MLLRRGHCLCSDGDAEAVGKAGRDRCIKWPFQVAGKPNFMNFLTHHDILETEIALFSAALQVRALISFTSWPAALSALVSGLQT